LIFSWNLTILVTDSETELNGHSEKVIGVILGPLEQKLFAFKDKVHGKNSSLRHFSPFSQQGDIPLTIDEPGKLLLIGLSKDLGFCKAITKNDSICNVPINMSQGKHCLYHLKVNYKKISSLRSQVQMSFTGNALFDNGTGKRSNQNKRLKLGHNQELNVDPPRMTPITNKGKEELIQDLCMRKDLETKALSKVVQTPLTMAAKNLAAITNPKSLPVRETAKHRLSSVSDVNPFPLLGKGLKKGAHINLSNNNIQKAKQIVKLKPIVPEDPNAVKKKIKLEKIIEKVDQNVKKEEEEAGDVLDDKKIGRKRKLEMLDEAINRRSSHQHEVDDLETETVDRYFDLLEKREQVEEKLESTQDIKCKVVCCKICKYTAHSASEICSREKHDLIFRNAVKKFFKCTSCHKRIFIFDDFLPTKPCRHCGEISFEKTSIRPISKGLQLESEKLLLRGEEVKFLNTLKS